MIPSSGSETALTSADYLLYRRCPRSLHLKLSGHDLPHAFDVDRLYPVESERRRVVSFARLRYPDGIDASSREPELRDGDDDVRTLFDAWCRFGPFVAHAEVRHPQKPSGTAIVLVREATSIKESYLYEAAFADYCFTAVGAAPERIYIQHVDKSYERDGEIDPSRFLTQHDVTRRVRRMLPAIAFELENLAVQIDADPLLAGYHEQLCGRPRACPVCSRDIPEHGPDHVVHLHRGGPLIDELLDDGITEISSIPRERLVHRRQEIQQQTLRTGTPHVDIAALREFLSRLEPPIAYLDFEATSNAVPPMNGTRPWEHVPYLYSLHVEGADGSLTHYSYLIDPGLDGRAELARSLVTAAGGCGCVVVYSAGFERAILSRLARAVPDSDDELRGLAERIVDLLEPFNEFAFHHSDQRGKVNLKTVLPVLTEHDYSDEEIHDGYTANLVYRYLSERAGQSDSAGERSRLLAALESYCAMDTMAMVHIVHELRELAYG